MARSPRVALVTLALLSSLLAAPAAASDPPPAPQGLWAAAEDAAIRLRWSPGENATNASLWGYRVYLLENGSRAWLGNASPNQTEYLDAPLPYGVTRTYHVTAIGLDGLESAPSGNATATTARPPGPPRNATATGQVGGILVAWSPPEDGGAWGYVVRRGTAPAAKEWWASTGQTSVFDEFAQPGVTYYYEVAAYGPPESGFIEGAPSNEASNRSITAPTAPMNLTGAASGTAASLWWDRPLDDGNAPLTYRVWRTLGNATTLAGETTNASFWDGGLADGTTYAYAVSAANAAGEGPRSESITLATGGAPPAPAWAHAEVLDGAIRVHWGSPPGNATLSAYRVYAGNAPDNVSLIAEMGPDARNLTEPLPYGVTRHYRVTAVSDEGIEGPPSPTVNATTVEPPGAPGNLTASASPGAIHLAWRAPTTGGAATGYVVFAAASAPGPYEWVGSTGSTSFTHEWLPAGATRHYKVQALNALEGGTAGPVNATTPSRPDAPTALRVASGERSLDLRWDAPARDGGSPLLAYRVYRGENATNMTLLATVNASATSHHDAPLPDGATRHYRVAAVNAVGEGPWSASASNATYGPPTAPQGLAATAANGTVRLAWSAPAQPNGTTAYRVYRDAGGGPAYLGTTGNLSWEDASPPRRVNLTYAVRAVNVAGEGAASNGAGAWLPDVPGAPRNLAASGLSRVTVKWDAPLDDGGSPLLAYRLYRAVNGGPMTLLVEQPADDRDHVDRTCGATNVCAYRVAAVNAAGEGARSNEALRL